MSKIHVIAGLAVLAIILISLGIREYRELAPEREQLEEVFPRQTKPAAPKIYTDEDYEKFHAAKVAAMEKVLGAMDDTMGQSKTPFEEGGRVDLYYFTKGIPGTAMATMQLFDVKGDGVRANRIGRYELVAFTRLARPKDGSDPNAAAEFADIQDRLCDHLTRAARQAQWDVVQPGDTADFPTYKGETVYLIFDECRGTGQDFVVDGKRYCLLLCMEIHKSEYQWAMRNGGARLIEKLKAAGHYPYSDMDRESVVEETKN
jgi:hypothetical protein